MSTRQYHLQEIAETLRKVEHGADPCSALRELLISQIAPYQRDALEAVRKTNTITSADLGRMQGWAYNYASNALNELWGLGILKRDMQRNESARYFVYRLAEGY